MLEKDDIFREAKEETKKKTTEQFSTATKTYSNFKQMLNLFYQREFTDISKQDIANTTYDSIRIIPILKYHKSSNSLQVEFKIGQNQFYRIKDLAKFYDCMQHKEYFQYGPKLGFVHEEEIFDSQTKELLPFLLKYAEMIKYINSSANNTYRCYGKTLNENCIILSNSALDEIFSVLNGKTAYIQHSDTEEAKLELLEEEPPIRFILTQKENQDYTLTTNVDIYEYKILEGKDFAYFLFKNTLFRCPKEWQESVLKLLELFRKNLAQEILFQEQDLPDFLNIIYSKVQNNVKLKRITKSEIEKYSPPNLKSKVFLDFNKSGYLTAKVTFNYPDIEFNPLENQTQLGRNMLQEAEALNMFRQTGFLLDQKRVQFILTDNNKIYQFLNEDINLYITRFELMVTDTFKEKQIRKPKIGKVGIKVENNLLQIDIEDIEFDAKQIEEIMKQYSIKKKYFRLKDGSFLNLEGSKELEFLSSLQEDLGMNYEQLLSGNVQLPIQRSMYLNTLLTKLEVDNVKKEENYLELIDNLTGKKQFASIPKELSTILRNYQEIGFQWLKTLDNYQFGGILADDMGLGKTIQMIALMQWYCTNTKPEEKLPCLVISPSSLTLNWENEIKKFTPNLKTVVINGTMPERKRKIQSCQKYDIIITSYDLLKRDMGYYEPFIFQYAVADEAQYIKNSSTQNAKALKSIRAKTRYALTGTPIENSLSELWSIFDYIMPGYLFSYNKFKERYESPIIKDDNSYAGDKLKRLISPFVLRRNKKEVLAELPDKIVTVLNNQMEAEQEKIYLSYLAQARKEIMADIQNNTLEKSNIQILALLTRLRQICCHPSLFLEDYKGESSKLNQCIEIIKEAIQSGHKILLFSGYTSMFPMIEKILKQEQISYYKLTGETKVSDRIKLVDDFNKNQKIKVFLISLKAGGTGLNLTGADVVIHYDPWWNSSVENQATDRAHRIGQKNNVQVYKLITKNSIEEKIYELQQKKSELMDSMLNNKTIEVNKLSKEDILALFS